MLRQAAKQAAIISSRNFSTSNVNNYKVTVVGGAGGIGQPLSLLLKLNPLISHLSVYDVAPVTPGVACDLSHMDTNVDVAGFVGAEQLSNALKDSHIVVIPAGVPRKPGMTRDDLFNTNASIAKGTVEAITKSCPNACIAIITNPVNSLVPMAAEVLKKAGCYDPRKLFGVTTLDVVRARAFIGHLVGCDPTKVQIPVIGGHAGITIMPVLSQGKPQYKAAQDKIEALTARIQDAGTEVVKAKAGGGSATLSMAYAASLFTNSLLRGLNGEKNVVECTYVESNVTDASFFATPVLLGKRGLEENLGLPTLNSYEQTLVKAAVPELQKNIKKGVDFAHAK